MQVKAENVDSVLSEDKPPMTRGTSQSRSPRQSLRVTESPRAEDRDLGQHRTAPRSLGNDGSQHSPPSEVPQVDCQICRVTVSFEDHHTGHFTLKYWEAHNARCTGTIPRPQSVRSSSKRRTPVPGRSSQPVSPSQSPKENENAVPVDASTPSSATEVTHVIQGKRRRAKRTEEERIEYLANDPYVSQYEAYRVLCGSCKKWIRLRPNSTYCSIPWDAHRKSCLAKKLVSNDGEEAVSRRNAVLERDPNIRKFDVERVLCALCDVWVSVQPNDYQAWLDHREKCSTVMASSSKFPLEGRNPPFTNTRLSPTPVDPVSLPPASRHSQTLLSHVPARRISTASHTPPHSPGDGPEAGPSSDKRQGTADSASSDSRRRNESQRAATLRSDRYIEIVEPGRVFCSLCQKWVQLRQDSTFCAYPWHQHRAKCLARHDKRKRKAGEILGRSEYPSPETSLRARSPSYSRLPEDAGQGSSSHTYGEEDEDDDEPPRKRTKGSQSIGGDRDTEMVNWRANAQMSHIRARKHEASSEHVEEERHGASLDLRSENGRSTFIMWSISHLFHTSYSPQADELSVSALLTYLNAALPPDKYDEFDFREVVRIVDALSRERKFRDASYLKLNGDMIRWA